MGNRARPLTPFALPPADQAALEDFTHTGCRPERAVRRAQTLPTLATGIGQQATGKAVGLSRQAVREVRHRYEEGDGQVALAEAPRSGAPARFDGPQRAAVTALACTPAPTGHARWTLRLLADRAVELGLVDSISHETVSQVLKKTSCSPTAGSIGAWGR